ncbi:MAG: tyrosine-type recombinase/integrase [Kiritimatiellaeota bacterium]|nr:tyrosine-type recombinase/integrase [Kiritimatiellota bacterium]
MWLELKKYPDGNLRPMWFGAYDVNRKRRVVTLSRWKGDPPASGMIGDRGSDVFEASRQAALEQLRQVVEGAKSDGDREQLVQRIHRHRYGHKVETVPLATLAQAWSPRKANAKPFHIENCQRVIQRFVDFMRELAPDMKDLGAVQGEHIRKFFRKRMDAGISAKTYNTELVLLRGLFKRLEPFGGAYREFLQDAVPQDAETVHREPFNQEELKDVFAAAAEDPLMYDLIVTAVCTAMRRSDVARLQWRSVDLKQGFITVKTSKTGETVEIPILPFLREVLIKVMGTAKPAPTDYVFPEAARLIDAAPETIDRRLRQVLFRAGYVDTKVVKRIRKEEEKRVVLPMLPPETTLRRGLSAVEAASMTEKRRARMKEILTRYMGGLECPQIAEQMHIARGLAHTRLTQVEQMIGAQVVRRPALPAVIRGSPIAEKSSDVKRTRRGSLKGWHSFRTTWITLALSAGVPMELVCRVTGHATTDVVLKHYFRPGREAFKKALQEAMPKMLSDGSKSPKDEVLEILEGMTARTWKKNVARVRELVAAL